MERSYLFSLVKTNDIDYGVSLRLDRVDLPFDTLLSVCTVK